MPTNPPTTNTKYARWTIVTRLASKSMLKEPLTNIMRSLELRTEAAGRQDSRKYELVGAARYTESSRCHYAAICVAGHPEADAHRGDRHPGRGGAGVPLHPDAAGPPRHACFHRPARVGGAVSDRAVSAPEPAPGGAGGSRALYRYRADRDVPVRNPRAADPYRTDSLAGDRRPARAPRSGG